jgi:predicted cobalt transporter CbtA
MMSLRRLMAGLAAAAVISVSMGFTSPASAQQLTPEQRKAQAQARAAQGKAAPAAQPQRAPAPQAQRAPAPAPQAQRAPAPQQQARRSGGGGNTGRNVAIGVGAAIIGGVLLSEAARAENRRRGVVVVEEYEDDDDRRQRCADRYRSFDWDDGTYANRDGDRVVCPYLR